MKKSPYITSLEDMPEMFSSEPGSALYKQKLELDRIKDELLKFGLSANQAKVYIFLGKYGARTVPDVFKALDLPRTETYHILNTLQNQGIVRTECCQPVKFEALPLSHVIRTLVNSEKERCNILLEQEKKIVELWNKIPSYIVETTETKTEKLQTLQGAPQIHNKMKEIISSAKDEMLLYCTEKDFSRFYHADLIKSLVDSTAYEKVIISPAHLRSEMMDEVNRDRIRIMPTGKSNNLCFLIKDNTEVLFFLRNANHPSHNIFAVWTDSRSMLDSLGMLFDFSWENSEPLY